MTATDLALSYFKQAEQRLEVLPEYIKLKAWPVMVRESQEILELATKAMLRFVGVEPPKWHDVGPLLLEYRQRFGLEVGTQINDLVQQSLQLRKDREHSFYGDIDLIPENVYGEEQAISALGSARLSIELARKVLFAVQ